MKSNNIFKFVFIILILVFLFLIVASQSGYYEYELSRKTKLTDEAIDKFENDVKEGKNIDNLELDELITDFTVGPDGMIYGYNPFSEEYLFMFCKSSE